MLMNQLLLLYFIGNCNSHVFVVDASFNACICRLIRRVYVKVILPGPYAYTEFVSHT